MWSSRQHLALTKRASSHALAEAYFAFLGGLAPLVRITSGASSDRGICLFGVTVLRLERTVTTKVRTVYSVTGGLLAHPGGTFAFTLLDDGVELLLKGFRPRLPGLVYAVTQLPLHVLLSWAFGWHLRRRGPPVEPVVDAAPQS